jgi:uncharacterized membrane protein YjfL (UPF0719 family)
VAVGAGLGILNVIFNFAWARLGSRAPIDLSEQTTLAAVSAAGGAIIAFVLYFTKSFRKRGVVHHYLSWMLASVVAALVLVLPDIASEGLAWSIAFSFWLGISAGLGLGVFARQLQGTAANE